MNIRANKKLIILKTFEKLHNIKIMYSKYVKINAQ